MKEPERVAQPRTFLMCPPTYYDVVYAINPWMDVTVPVDKAAAFAQWAALKAAYEAYGHTVYTIAPEPGLPDMVYAANGGLTIAGQVLAPNFAVEPRQAESAAYAKWFVAAVQAGVLGPGGKYLGQAEALNEGEGDLLLAGKYLLCGAGTRTAAAAHAEIARRFSLADKGIKVVSLELVDPLFYHLDTALAVLADSPAAGGEATVAYLPKAFSPASQNLLRQLFPNAIIASENDGLTFGLNVVSDGRHVFLNEAATDMQQKLKARGFMPVGIQMSELLKGGGSVKCCTLTLRASDSDLALH